MTALLTLDRLTVRRGPRVVLEDVSLTLAAGEMVGLIGPNGAGKSTLMRAALGLIPAEGRSSLAALPRGARARAAAWLPQSREIAWPVTVEALVALGRTPHAPGPADRPAIEAALGRMDLHPLRHRKATELSGGEQARVLIARALAQEAPLLIADEPAAGLDPAQQLSVMATFAALAQEGQGILVSLHDLGLAARFCARLVVIGPGGRLVADGPPAAVLTPRLLARTFGITALRTEADGAPILVPTGLA